MSCMQWKAHNTGDTKPRAPVLQFSWPVYVDPKAQESNAILDLKISHLSFLTCGHALTHVVWQFGLLPAGLKTALTRTIPAIL